MRRVQRLRLSKMKCFIKKFYFTIFIFAVIILAGCAGSGSKSKAIDVFSGTEGIAAEFAKTAPPQSVFESSNFPIFIKLKNIGAYNIPESKKGVLSIGIEKDYVKSLKFEPSSSLSDIKDNQASFYLRGKEQINPKGEDLVVPITAATGRLDPQSERRESTLTATLCYPYKTVLSTTVCIDTDTAGIRPGKKVCEVKDMTFSNGQGAPVAVTRIEPQMVPDGELIKPQFLIFVENSGRGNPVDSANYNSICGSQDAEKGLWNVAHLSAFAAGDIQMICCPNDSLGGQCTETETSPDKMKGFVRFRDRKDFVRCTFRNGIKKTDDTFTSPLRIEIDYGYVQTIAANFVIQRPVKY